MTGPNPDTLAALTALLEPAAVAALGTSHAVAFEASAAISAKRQADALEKIAEALSGDHFHTIDNMLFQFGQTLGRGFEIGARK